jgi:hypothetical protein
MRENDPDTGNDAYVDLAEPAAVPAGSPTAPFIPIANFRRFAAIYMTSVGTGGITAFKIMAGDVRRRRGAVAVVSHALGSNPDAVGDFVTLECDVEQIREVLVQRHARRRARQPRHHDRRGHPHVHPRRPAVPGRRAHR